jgi:hypothetical protein
MGKRRTLRTGATGEDVVLLQSWLKITGTYEGPLHGIVDDETNMAIREFQLLVEHLKDDGVVGENTWGSLEQAVDYIDPEEDHPPAVPENRVPDLHLGERTVPDSIWEHFQYIVKAITDQGVGYAPGRGLVQKDEDRFIVTMGPNRLGNKNYKVKGQYRAGFVCSTFTYFLLCMIFRVNKGFRAALAGGIPPLSKVLEAAHRIHPVDGSRYGFWGFGPWTELIPSDGTTKERIRRAAKYKHIDIVELYGRRKELPDIMFAVQSTRFTRGWKWGHHTCVFWVDKEAPGCPMYRMAADGSKPGKVFSNTTMDVERITQDFSQGRADKYLFKIYGITSWEGVEKREAWPIAFETDMGVIDVPR